MKLTTEQLSQTHDPELVAFLDALSSRNPSALAYYYPSYRNMLCGLGIGDPLYLGTRDNSKLIGLLPIFRKKSPLGTVLNSLPFFGPNAGVLCSPENSQQIHRDLLKSFADLAESEDAISSAIYTPFLFNNHEWYEEALPNAIRVEKFTQHIELLPESSWSSKIRYDLKKATDAGVTVTKELTPDRLDTFYRIYQQNCEEYHIPLKSKKCLDLLLSADILGRNSEIYFAFHEGTMIGGLLVLFSPATVSYYIPCTLPQAKTLQPGTVLIDAAATEARKRNISYWNWESSPDKNSGVYRFKKKWGSAETAYRVYVTPRRPKGYFTSLGAEKIKEFFQYYFVYPFDLL